MMKEYSLTDRKPTNNNCYFKTKTPLLKAGQKIIFAGGKMPSINKTNK